MPAKKVNKLYWLFCIGVVTLLSGCAGSSLFVAYPQQIKPMIEKVKNNLPTDLATCNECKGNDRILYSMERGRISQVVGQSDLSMQYFKTAIDQVQANEQKATISASSVGSTVGAVAVNDNAIPYAGDGYEKVMLYHYQGMNYLANNDIEGAGVEFRRANKEQEELLKRFEKEIEEVQEKSAKQKSGNSAKVIEARYAQMDELAGKVKNSFQNAYSFYLSGILYELLKQPNDAYIDYKKALEIYPDNTYLQKDVVRLAATLNMREDLEELTRRFSLDPKVPVSKGENGNGEIIVLFEDGFVPTKEEVKIPLPIPKVGIIALAFPVYDASWSAQVPLQLTDNNQVIGSTEPICDFRSLAVKSLKEKVPAMTVRQIARAISKGATAKVAKDQGGVMGELLSSVWNLVSENADLRSWLTLPSNSQIMRASVPAGSHDLVFQQDGVVENANVVVPANGKVILHVVRMNTRFYVKPITFPMTQQASN